MLAMCGWYVYNTERGFIDSVNAAIHDKDNKPSVLSISWGAAEDEWSQEAIISMNRAFETAAKPNITVLCASGDNGSNRLGAAPAGSDRIGRMRAAPDHREDQQQRAGNEEWVTPHHGRCP